MGLRHLAWLVAIIIFFPIFVMAITAFKNEREAQSLSLFFIPTLESFYEVFARSNYANYVWNSILAAVGSTLLCFALAIPAAYRMAFYPTHENAVDLRVDAFDQDDARGGGVDSALYPLPVPRGAGQHSRARSSFTR